MQFNTFRKISLPRSTALAAVLSLFLVLPCLQVQGQSQTSSDQKSASQGQTPAEAGGPQGDEGPMIIPKKKTEEEPAPPPPPKPKNPEGMPDFSVKVDVGVVNVPVLVETKDGQFIPGLKKDNFRIYEDGVPQNISNFAQQSQTPITAVMLVEFAATNPWFMYDGLNMAYTFASSLKPEDWVAVVSYDMKPQILVDFTQDKRQIYAALNSLRIPGFSETNLFDALYDTLDRLDRIEGRKYVVLISSGRDTFSKLTFDKILRKVKETPNVGIYAVSTGEALRMRVDAMAGNNPEVQSALMDYLQADNEMRTFAQLTGGRWYKPRFQGELPEIVHDIASNIRNEYNLAYHPTNAKLDGTYRKLKVEVVGPDGKPLNVKDQHGKNLKFQVIAREGYTAKHEVE